MACDLLVSIFVCGMPQLFRMIIGLFVQVDGMLLTIVSTVISSVLIYAAVKLAGRAGGILLVIVGLVGAIFSFGTSLALSVLGGLAAVAGKYVEIIVVVNIGMHVACMFLGCM